MLLLGDGFVAVGLLVLAGVIGFFVMSVALALRAGGFVLRALFGSANSEAPPHNAFRVQQGPLVCPHRRCGHLNQRGARFCARCGRSLRGGPDMDAYA